MYLGIDIGGTKTLVATLTNDGVITESAKFPTPENYEDFLPQLTKVLDGFEHKDFRAGTVAAPGTIDRVRERALQLPNVKGWKNVPLVQDIERIAHCPMRLENDAKLAGLSEAMLLKGKYSRVLYITISTGIGVGLIVERDIDNSLGDGGGRSMILEHNGKLLPWEEFGSGSAIVRKYGKMASEINDAKTWKEIVRTFSPGIVELVAILNPEVIVVGGGVGHYFDKFHKPLLEDLKKYETPLLKIPPMIGAKRPDEAVIYGCYDYARQKHK